MLVTVSLSSPIIRHYPNVTLDKCGIGRQSYKYRSTLSVNNNNHMSAKIQNGLIPAQGDWPWIVYLKSVKYLIWKFIPIKYVSCTGVILNKQWILTAAHCFRQNFKSTVRLVQDLNDNSHTYGVDKWFIHPKYRANQKGLKKLRYDVALLKLDTKLSEITDKFRTYPTINGICLPDNTNNNNKNIVINTNVDNDEWALMAGFGKIDVGVDNQGPVLRAGWTRFEYMYSLYDGVILASRYPENVGAGSCAGDSGGPLVQYITDGNGRDSGRAVLIGIAISIDGNQCLNKSSGNYMYFARVSKLVDWIQDTVRYN
ncbi:chymotrypsinogen A-like [Oppia nitens]|uniref:chymotrypsinogen A-like n=1 Tax=Oppia nitens TaxID=1686743 RepID=UPI0023D97A36|nr:chymotrypsinogen A-like [Oppia nitens]